MKYQQPLRKKLINKSLPCPVCDTKGEVRDAKTDLIRKCVMCHGTGWYVSKTLTYK